MLYFQAKDKQLLNVKKGDGKILGKLTVSNLEAYERLRDACEKLKTW